MIFRGIRVQSHVLEWLSARDPVLVYAFLLLNAALESLFPPYPSDIFVLVFAFLAGRGGYNILLVYLLTVLGSIAGILILYYAGKIKGDALINVLSRTFLGKLFSVRMIEGAKQKFTSKGDMLLLLNRFLPGMRAPICFAAGLVKTDLRKSFPYIFLSVLFWNLFLVIAGFYVGKTWQQASRFIRDYSVLATITVFLLLTGITVMYFSRRKRP